MKSQSTIATKTGTKSETTTGKKVGTKSGTSLGTPKIFQASEFKNLVHNQGKVVVGGKQYVLQTPSYNDPSLQTIISDPKFTVQPAGTSQNGHVIYMLKGAGKKVKVTLRSQSH